MCFLSVYPCEIVTRMSAVRQGNKISVVEKYNINIRKEDDEHT